MKSSFFIQHAAYQCILRLFLLAVSSQESYRSIKIKLNWQDDSHALEGRKNITNYYGHSLQQKTFSVSYTILLPVSISPCVFECARTINTNSLHSDLVKVELGIS